GSEKVGEQLDGTLALRRGRIVTVGAEQSGAVDFAHSDGHQPMGLDGRLADRDLDGLVLVDRRLGERAPVRLRVSERSADALVAVRVVGIPSEDEQRSSSAHESDAAADAVERIICGRLVEMAYDDHADPEPGG